MSRDIDLQAILDAPDSDSSESESDVIDELPQIFERGISSSGASAGIAGYYHNLGSSKKKSSKHSIHKHLSGSSNNFSSNDNTTSDRGGHSAANTAVSGTASSNYTTTNVDLEKILMEHDDDTDDVDTDDTDEEGIGGRTRGIDANTLLRKFELNASPNDDNFSLGASTIPTLPSYKASTSPLRRRRVVGVSGTVAASSSPAISAVFEDDQDDEKNEFIPGSLRDGQDLNSEHKSPDRATTDQNESFTEIYSPSRFLKKSAVYDMPRLSSYVTNEMASPALAESGAGDLDDSGKKKRRGPNNTSLETSDGNDQPQLHVQQQKKSSQEKNNEFMYTSSCRNPEEWAVLQSILNNDDNDDSFEILSTSPTKDFNPLHDSKDSLGSSGILTSSRKSSIFRAESNASTAIDVDAILYSMDDDSDDEANLAELDEMISKFSLGKYVNNSISNSKQKRSFSSFDPFKEMGAGGKLVNSVPFLEQNEVKAQDDVPCPRNAEDEMEKVKTESSTVANKPQSAVKSQIKKYHHQHNISSLSSSDTLTESALKHAEDYERRLLRPGHRDIVSPLMVKRRMKPKIELETKSRLQKQQSSKNKSNNQFSQHNQGFNFSGMIAMKPMQRIGAELLQCSQYQKDTVGLPTALAIGSKFIAIGTQRGIILVFDLFEELRQQLGLPVSGSNTYDTASASVKKYGAVSSIDLSANGENLIAGYTSGCIVLWDVIKGTIVKAVPDMHPSPITSLRFISEKTLSFVSVDVGGLVNKVSFTKPLLWTTYNVESECLLDGTAGQILAFSILPPISSLKYTPMNNTDNKKQPYHQSVNQIILIALSSAKSSFAIAVEPSNSVLYKWAKPPLEDMNVEAFIQSKNNESDEIDNDRQESSSTPDTFLPCLAWNWAIVSGGEHSVTPILARGWGCCIQFLRGSFPPYEETESKSDESIHWPAFGTHDEFRSSAPVVALEWLGNRSLVYLTLTNELTVVDTVMMTLMERLDFSGIKLVYAEFALSRNGTTQPSHNQDSDNVMSTTFQNSMISNEGRILVLCQEELKSLSIIEIQQRITTLEEDGEWLEALALALDHYDSTVKSQEDRKREPDVRHDIMSHPEFVSKIRKSKDEEWIAELLLRYLNLAVENAPESTLDRSTIFNKSSSRRQKNSRIDLAQSHFQMLAGVCIEFCIVTRRLDLLFNDVYQRFRDSGYTDVFLDVLEPYVLNDKLQYIAPEVMSQFVEHCKTTNDVSTVERCLLHMDVTIMDFDTILSLLRKNGMYSALIHVYTHGLDDFVSPLEHLFEAIFDTAATESGKQRRLDGSPQTAFERYGYKAILYLRHCFTNRTFPQGQELKPENRVDTLRPELLQFLKAKKYTSPTRMTPSELLARFRQYDYPYIRVLLVVDAKAFLDALSIIFDSPEVRFIESTDNQDTMDDWHNMIEQSPLQIENESTTEEVADGSELRSESFEVRQRNEKGMTCPDRMDFARIISLSLTSLESTNTIFGNVDQFQVTKNAFYDFMGKYLLKGLLRAPPSLTMSVIARMTSRLAQDDVIKLLQVLPRKAYDREKVLQIVEGEGMTRAALHLYKSGVVELFEGTCTSDAGAHHFRKVIECYLKDEDIKFRLGAFDYVKKECIGGSTFRTDGDERTVHDVLRNALCEKLSALVNLDPVLSAQLVAEIYIDELETILEALKRAEEGMVQFKFFHAIISGDLTKADVVAGPVLLSNLTVDHHQQYLELMARFHPEMVYQHLITHDNYRAEECLQLCQAHEIADASAYLLERMGNVSSALQLMLQTLEGRMMTLKRVVRGLSTSSSYPLSSRKMMRRNHIRKTNSHAYHDIKETQSVRQILTVALDLCERNSSTSSDKSGHGSQLWFNVLDRLINAKGFLRLSKELPEHCEIMLNVLSDLLKMTMQRMVSNVALPDLVRKITSDHSGNHLGEFREMISTMLSTYGSELEICGSAVDVMNDDVHKLLKMKFNLKMRGAKIGYVDGIALSKDGQHPNQNFSRGSFFHVGTTGNATTTSSVSDLRSEVNDVEGAKTALARLRAKRRTKQKQKLRHGKRNEIQIGMMTSSDKLYANGGSSDAAYMPRYVGSLSSAEHYGRLQ